MKKLFSLLLVLCMILSMTACAGNNAEDVPSDTQSVKDQLENQGNDVGNIENADNTYIKDKVTIAWSTATSLTPWGTANDIPGNYEVYEMLYECDAGGDMYPLLADGSYEGNYLPGCDHEPGTAVYTVKIYDYITDHNGHAVTAEDVAFSYMYQYENESTSGWGDLVSVEAADPTTVVFTFTEEQNGLGEMLNVLCRCFIVDQESFEASASGLVNEMCGTGPYKFGGYESGSSLTLVRNAEYWQKDELRRQEQQANVETIVYQFIDESAQKVIGLKTNTLDIVKEIDSSSALEFADGGEFADQFNIYTYQAKHTNFLTANCSPESLCGNLNLRLAVFNAVDVDGLITALGGTSTRVHAYVSPYYSDYDFVDWAGMDNYNTRTSVDAEVVKGYLEAAGYKGETLKLVTIGGADAGNVIAAQLAIHGINVEVQALDFATYLATEGDPTAWDLNLGMMAGDYNVTVWQHGFSFQNTGEGDHSANFVYDKAWDDLLNLCCTEEGHTPENMEKWWQMAVDNAYTLALYCANTYVVIPEDMTYVCMGDKLTILPGACTYEAS